VAKPCSCHFADDGDSIFWVDSRYPALMKRDHAGTEVKASGELTFRVVYQVDRSMSLARRA
jgi:hypothetical protein